MTEQDSRGGREGPVALGDTRLMREFEKRARQQLKPPTPAQQRVIEAASLADTDAALSLLYQHSALCQAFLPYRDPGDEARSWERLNGNVHLEILAGKAMHPIEERFIPVGLPFGPKARLVLMHINQQALLAQSPEIEVQDTLTSFVRRSLKLDTGGRTVRTVKDQLARLSAASIRLGVVKDGRARTVNSKSCRRLISGFPKTSGSGFFGLQRCGCLWTTGRVSRPTRCPSSNRTSPRYRTAEWRSISTPGSHSDCTACRPGSRRWCPGRFCRRSSDKTTRGSINSVIVDSSRHSSRC